VRARARACVCVCVYDTLYNVIGETRRRVFVATRVYAKHECRGAINYEILSECNEKTHGTIERCSTAENIRQRQRNLYFVLSRPKEGTIAETSGRELSTGILSSGAADVAGVILAGGRVRSIGQSTLCVLELFC